MLLQLIFISNYPNFVHHNVFSQNVATIELIKTGNIQSISRETMRLWPGFPLAAAFMELITGMDTVTLNVFMLSLFVLLIGTTAYLISYIVFKITKNKIAMYTPIFMWIFFFNNRILYELMFHHQWYAITLFVLLIFVMLQLELKWEQNWRKQSLFIITIISAAITIIHPITGFIVTIALFFYSIMRRIFFITGLTAIIIFISWMTFVSTAYIDKALQWLKVLLQSEKVSEFILRSFQLQESLPLYDAVAKTICKSYYIIAALISVAIFLASLFKKINEKRLANVILVVSCALVGIMIFAPLGIASGYFEDRMYWHIPAPLAIMSFTGIASFSNFLEKKKLNAMIMLSLVFAGLFSSSILAFGMCYYRIYYSPRSDTELSLWAIAHSNNGTKFGAGQMFRLPEYYAALYRKNIKSSSTEYFALAGRARSLRELLRPLEKADIILYTRHLEDSLQRGARNLGYSPNNETFNEAINSILKKCDIIYNNGLNIVYSHSHFWP
jgi:hypothetical protein